MCGRFADIRSPHDLAVHFGMDIGYVAAEVLERYPVWNVAPTRLVRVVAEVPGPDGSPIRVLRLARWGLVPSWAKDPAIGSKMINARAETVADKPSFSAAVRRRRCIIPADAYYEWFTDPATRKKTPFAIRPVDGAPFAFAGLYERWQNPADVTGNDFLVTCSIVTTAAHPDLANIHERQPAMLTADRWDRWLATDTSIDEALALLHDS